MLPTIRTVIEDDVVSLVIDREQAIYPRLEEAFDGLKWWLAREPESGEIIDDLYWLYKQRGNLDQNVPALLVTYTFDHKSVSLKSILVMPQTIP